MSTRVHKDIHCPFFNTFYRRELLTLGNHVNEILVGHWMWQCEAIYLPISGSTRRTCLSLAPFSSRTYVDELCIAGLYSATVHCMSLWYSLFHSINVSFGDSHFQAWSSFKHLIVLVCTFLSLVDLAFTV